MVPILAKLCFLVENLVSYCGKHNHLNACVTGAGLFLHFPVYSFVTSMSSDQQPEGFGNNNISGVINLQVCKITQVLSSLPRRIIIAGAQCVAAGVRVGKSYQLIHVDVRQFVNALSSFQNYFDSTIKRFQTETNLQFSPTSQAVSKLKNVNLG